MLLLLLLVVLLRVLELSVVAGGAVVTGPDPEALADPDPVASALVALVDSTFPPAEFELDEAGGGGGTADDDDVEDAGEAAGGVGFAGGGL